MPQSNIKIVEELHYKHVDGESKSTKKCSLVEIDLAVGKGTSSFVLTRKTNLSPIWELKPIPKPKKCLLV